MRRDVLSLAILLVVALTPVAHDVKQTSAAGPFARVAMNREIVNRGAFAHGMLPLWDPYEFGGRPHLANPETLALYPGDPPEEGGGGLDPGGESVNAKSAYSVPLPLVV